MPSVLNVFVSNLVLFIVGGVFGGALTIIYYRKRVFGSGWIIAWEDPRPPFKWGYINVLYKNELERKLKALYELGSEAVYVYELKQVSSMVRRREN